MGKLLIRVIGYQPDCEVARELRVAAKTAIALAVVTFAATLLYITHREPAPTRGNIEILGRLDTFTKRARLDVGNTIPPFVASPGMIGRLASAGDASDAVTMLDEEELGRGFCSPSIADLVRHEYPGYYDRWSDDTLERAVIEKHPEYSTRYCMLSSRLDASADEVIKYELKQRSALAWVGVWMATLLLTGFFAIACVNAYYRLLVASARPPRRTALAA